MTHTISGKNIDLGVSLREHTEQALKQLEEKFHLSSLGAHVVFERTAHKTFIAHATITLDKKHTIVVEDDNPDSYSAVDHVMVKVDAQIKRLLERLDDHHKHHDNHKFIRKTDLDKIA